MTSAATVAVVNHRFANLDIEREVLSGHQVIEVHGRSEAEVLPHLRQVDAILLGSTPKLTAAGLATLERCRTIVRYGIGVDNVDVAEATARGILVCNVPDYCVEEVADHTLLLCIAMARKLLPAAAYGAGGQWRLGDLRPITELSGQVLGLVGFGKIARRLSAKSQALGLRVLAYDPFVDAAAMAEAGVEKRGLDDLLAAADIVSLHAPLTGSTRGMIGPNQLARMKSTAFLVNTSRAELVDEAALVQSLSDRRLAGCGLDVFWEEPPPPGHPLLGRSDVILTPHMAWYSDQSVHRLQRQAAEQARAVLSGQLPPFVINRS